MLKDLFSLAWQGTVRKKRSSILVFLVLLMSFSCAILSLSLTASISKTNEEYRLNTYGEWYMCLRSGKPGDREWLESRDWAGTVGQCTTYATIVGGGVGTADQSYLDLGRAEVKKGRLPEKPWEIAISERVLKQAGYEEWTLGEEVKLRLSYDAGNSKGLSTPQTFVLCGILNDFRDLWVYEEDGGKSITPAVNAVVTEETSSYMMADAVSKLAKLDSTMELIGPTEQYYVAVDREDRETAEKEGVAYFRATRTPGAEAYRPCVNYLAYPGQETAAGRTDEVYTWLIAGAALTAVLCVYLMGLSGEVHRFSVLRSVGMTKGQLLLLMLMESVLLAVPAAVLGIPLGAKLTEVSLRLLMYSESAPVRSVIPYEFLGKLLLLWLGVAMAARLIVYWAAIRTPLSGRLGMNVKNARRARMVRFAIIAVLLVCAGTTAVYTAVKSNEEQFWKKQYEAKPDYSMTGRSTTVLQLAYPGEYAFRMSTPVAPEQMETVEQVPGVKSAEGYMNGRLMLEGEEALLMSFPGAEEQAVGFYMVDEEYWDDVFNFGEDRQAFHNGDVILLCVDERYLLGNEKTVYPHEGENVSLRAIDKVGDTVIEDQAAVKIRVLPENMDSRGMYVSQNLYTMVFSEAYLQKFLAKLQPGKIWGPYAGGEAFGYAEIRVTADLNAGDLSVDGWLEAFCKENKLEFTNDRESLQPRLQAAIQGLILLYACGGCVVVISLLLLCSALALETEQEKKSYGILRTIGMSRKQVKRQVFGRALAWSVGAMALGWGLNWVFSAWKTAQMPDGTFIMGLKSFVSGLKFYRITGGMIAAFSALGAAVLLLVWLPVKRRLWRDD